MTSEKSSRTNLRLPPTLRLHLTTILIATILITTLMAATIITLAQRAPLHLKLRKRNKSSSWLFLYTILHVYSCSLIIIIIMLHCAIKQTRNRRFVTCTAIQVVVRRLQFEIARWKSVWTCRGTPPVSAIELFVVHFNCRLQTITQRHGLFVAHAYSGIFQHHFQVAFCSSLFRSVVSDNKTN